MERGDGFRELSLFTGVGGGLLGSKLLGWEPVGYVEWNDFCQRIIAQRIADGILPEAPIFGDISAFIAEGIPLHSICHFVHSMLYYANKMGGMCSGPAKEKVGVEKV